MWENVVILKKKKERKKHALCELSLEKKVLWEEKTQPLSCNIS